MRSYNSRLIKQPVIGFKLPPIAILKFLNFFGVAATALVVLLALFIYSGGLWAQNYYVDATNGNDSWQGTLPDAQGANGPWKTLSKVNQTYFVPGDSVLLKCGQIWNETLAVTSSGVAGSPVTYGAYGSCNGINKPVIDGSAPVNGWVDMGGGIYSTTASLIKPPLNRIGNGSFDIGIAEWSVWSADGGATRDPMADCGATGACLFFTPSAGTSASLITTPIQFGVTAGVTYRVTFVARGSQATSSFGVFPRDAVDYSNIASSNHSLTTAWQTYTFTFTPAASHATARIDFQMPAGSNLHLDNVTVIRVTPESDTAKQVFLDSQYQSLAHYPNRGFDATRPTNMFLTINNNCSGGPTTSLAAGSDLILTSAQQADLAGAVIHFRSNAWTIEDRTITAFDTSARTFSWATNSSYDICKNWGYYLDNKLWMLDSSGEWYYDAGTQQLYLNPGTGTPEGRVVVGHRDFGIYMDRRTYILIDGLSIRKTVTGITAQNGSNLIIRNTDVVDSEGKAINVYNSPDSVIVGCRIANSVRDGIWAVYGRNTHIANNIILNTGTIGSPRKSVAAIHAGCFDCGATAGNVVIEGNEIRNSGYLGIFMPVQATVRNNYFVDSCMVLDDCGAIYTGGREFKATGTRNNSRIEKNIIVNAWGNPDGRPANFASAAQGIYLDDFSNTVTVTGNTVINADHGMQLHNAAENTVSNNAIYGSRAKAVWMQEDTLGSPGDIHDNLFSGNSYFQLNKEPTYLLDSANATVYFSSYNNNRYSLLYSEIVGRERYSPAGTRQEFSYSFQDWIAAKGDVSSTAFDVFGVALNRVVSVNSANLISNGNFDANTAGWASWNSALDGVIGYVPCVTGPCLKYTSGTTSSILSSPRVLITKGKYYRVRMDLHGEQGNEALRILMRLSGTAVDGSGSYAELGLHETKSLTSQWETYTFVFKATDSSPVNGARLDLEMPTASTTNRPIFYIDNVLIEEVSVDASVPADNSAIVVNPTLSAQLKNCPDTVTNPAKCSQYVRFTDVTPVSWPINVPAMGSEIVVWNNNPLKDTDRDGIADLDDLCPGTPGGTPVNERGCSFLQQHSSDLSVTLVVQPEALIGDVVSYTITVKNSGPSAATNVVTSGSLPFCSLGTISNGGSATCMRTVTANSVGALSQTVSVGATENDGNTANNSATAATAVLDKCAVTGGKNISGTVNRSNGTPSAGVNMLLIRTSITPQCGNRVTTGSNGGYIFTKISKATYSITPSKSTCANFTPKNRTVSMSTRDISGQNFTEACP